MKKVGQISCSLNLGLIYNLEYNFDPEGSSITVFFVNESGEYTHPPLFAKASVKIGNAGFVMTVISSKIELSQGRRVISVKLIDDAYLLDSFYVVLKGRGCGDGIYELGGPVDNRSAQEKRNASLTPQLESIRKFSEFEDIEYSFGDFLSVLRKQFSVTVSANYDNSLTQTYTGTFRDVLNNWCRYFNLAYFVENGTLKIFNPTTLSLQSPSQIPVDAISYESEVDGSDTYTKTVSLWFQQEGGYFGLNEASSSDNGQNRRYLTLYPIGSEFNLSQNLLDPNQVAASLYGEKFWLLYNYWLGESALENNCGWVQYSDSETNYPRSVNDLGYKLVTINDEKYSESFQAFQQYGINIAGKYYISNKVGDIETLERCTFFSEQDGQIFNFNSENNLGLAELLKSKQINVDILKAPLNTYSVYPNTSINSYFSGINYDGGRIGFVDTNKTTAISNEFALTGSLLSLVELTHSNLTNILGSSSIDYGTNAVSLTTYNPISMPQELIAIFNQIPQKAQLLRNRYSSIPIVGLYTSDYQNLLETSDEPMDVDIISSNDGPNVQSNTSVIKTIENGSYNIYYDKYQRCESKSSGGKAFTRRFDIKQVSSDLPVIFGYDGKQNTYKIQRDFQSLNRFFQNPYLNSLAQSRVFSTWTISYSLNYFENIPTNYLTNGLVGFSISVSDNGVNTTYTYSNRVLQVPQPDSAFEKYEREIRNSYIRKFNQQGVINLSSK